MRTILGGEPAPGPDEGRDPDEMRAWLLAAPTVDEFEAAIAAQPDLNEEDYTQCARVAARVMLEAFLAEPRLASLPLDAEYDWDADPDRGAKGMRAEYIIHRGLSTELRDRDVRLPAGMSGFQWGWAVNAARYCVELPPTPNPAIL